MHLLDSINRWIEKAETVLLVSILSIMVLLAFVQVLLRNLFAEGLLWGDILLRHLVLWVGFLGASLATREEKHISIDLFTRLLPPRSQNISRLITNLFAAVVCYFLADASYTFVADEMMVGTVLFSDMPAWYFQTIIPVGFGLMGLRFLFLSIAYLARYINPEAD